MKTYTYITTLFIALMFGGMSPYEAIAQVEVTKKPTASFAFMPDKLSVSFVNNSTHADKLIWHLGDGTIAEGANISHQYKLPGKYEVILIAQNKWGKDESTQVIEVFFRMDEEDERFNNLVKLSPNPLTNTTRLSFPNPTKQVFSLYVYDLQGKQVQAYKDKVAEHIDITGSELPSGVYLYELRGAQVAYGRFVVR